MVIPDSKASCQLGLLLKEEVQGLRSSTHELRVALSSERGQTKNMCSTVSMPLGPPRCEQCGHCCSVHASLQAGRHGNCHVGLAPLRKLLCAPLRSSAAGVCPHLRQLPQGDGSNLVKEGCRAEAVYCQAAAAHIGIVLQLGVAAMSCGVGYLLAGRQRQSIIGALPAALQVVLQ